MNRSSNFFLFALLASLALESPAAQAQPTGSPPVRTVNATFSRKRDAQGFYWDLNTKGYIGDGSNDCFDGGVRLQVNGSDFNPTRPTMTPDGNEYFLTSTIPNLQITRQIRFFLKESIVRYVDSFKNTSRAPVNVQALIYSNLGSSCQRIYASSGRPDPTSFEKNETGIIAYQASSSRPSVLLCVASPKSRYKPSIAVSSPRNIRILYNLTVPAGRTVSILHGVAQPRLRGVPTAKGVEPLNKPLLARQWTRDLPRSTRRLLVNWRSRGYSPFDSGTPLVSTIAELDVSPVKSDILAIGEETRLRGTLSCSELDVATAHGTLKVPLEKVAALAGMRFSGRSMRVFLRDGQILTGAVTVRDLRFVMLSGLTLDLSPGTLDRLVLRTRPEDGKPPEDDAIFVETFTGDRLALSPDAEFALAVITPWGPTETRRQDISSVQPLADQPAFAIELKDGSRFTALLEGSPLEIKTQLFGAQKFQPTDIKRISLVQARPLDDFDDFEGDDPGRPYVTVVGDGTLVGRLDVPTLYLATTGERIPIPPAEIRTLTNLSEDGEESGGPQFRAELWDGDVVVGRIEESVLPVRLRHSVWQVPARDIVSVVVPYPTVSESLRKKISELLRKLGDPQFDVRESASRELADLAHLAKAQLDDAAKQTKDPEIRRRVRELLEELE